MKREYLPENLVINSWDSISGYFSELNIREISSVNELKRWLKDRSELESVLDEDLAWRYIKMNCDTTDEALADKFNIYISEIEPEIVKQSNLLDERLVDLSDTIKLLGDADKIMLRSIRKNIEMFREKNISIFAKLQQMEQEYGKIVSEMTIEYQGKELTLHEAANFLKDTSREVRKEVFELIGGRRLKDVNILNDLLSKLIEKRNQIAINADYSNYRDYKVESLGRFDYTISDVLSFHGSIVAEVKPIVEEISKSRKQTLGYEQLRPWDLAVDINLKPALKPFSDTNELVNKTIKCFSKVKPEFASFIKVMNELNYLDLDARKGKAPGGFNYPLHESNIPFIFMNATGNLRDLETMVHEGGHAIHSFLSKDLELVNYKSTPSEVAELASMSMELISMEYWDVFFDNEEDLKRAKRSQLEGVINVLPWVATVDKFQHWLYLNPYHNHKQRQDAWVEIANEFGSNTVDWTGHEDIFATSWQKQLHIFEVPFYYIEYAIAQLGAIAVWKKYKENPEKAIKQYENALQLGYTKTIPEIYKTAGIRFDFSKSYVKELMNFVKDELKKYV